MVLPTGSSTELSDAAYLLEVFTTIPEIKGDWNHLALKHVVHISTVPRRVKAIAKRHVYKFENGKVTQDGEDGVDSGQFTDTPTKAKAKRGPKSTANAKSTPTPKKRKLSKAVVKDEEDVDDAQDVVKAARADKYKPIERNEGGHEEIVEVGLGRFDGEDGGEIGENDEELA